MKHEPRVPEQSAQPGELRFAGSPSGERLPSGLHARLVLLLERIGSDVVLALLVTEDVSVAGPTDVVLAQAETGLDLRLCVQSDLAMPLTVEQLGPITAEIGGEVLDVVAQAVADGDIPEGRVADGLPRGLPIGSPEDPRWNMKLAELADVQTLSRTVSTQQDFPPQSTYSRWTVTAPPRYPDDIKVMVSVWQTEIVASSGPAAALRTGDGTTASSASLSLTEEAFVELVGRRRLDREALPTLRLRIDSEPAQLRVRLTVPGGLADPVRGISVVADGSAGNVRVPLDVKDRHDVVFHGATPWPAGETAATPSVRIEVTRRWR